eukprot:12923291-Prorocentrum_lima.AAC.1
MHGRYGCLLGALAWLLMSRSDIARLVGFVQRQAHKPKNRHLKYNNRVLRYCKRVKTGMHFKELVAPVRVV